MAQKYKNSIFEPTLSAHMSACQYLPMDFYCLSETPLYALSKTIKVPMGCWHFLLQGNKLLTFKKIVLKNGQPHYLDNVGQHSK